jgi:hypothetical protein
MSGNEFNKKSSQIDHVFVFLEVFRQEGGIQSYVKDIFRAYSQLKPDYKAEVFLLRDSADCDNPFVSNNLKFHYFSGGSPILSRLKL